MKDWLVMHALTIALPAIIGPITYILGRKLLNGFAALDTLPAIAKQGVVLALAIGLAALAQAAGIMLPSECAAIGTGALTSDCQSALASPVFLKGVVGALLAYLLHYLKKADPTT